MNVLQAKIVPLIEIKTKRGDGPRGNPIRTIAEFWNFDGTKLVEIDSHFDFISLASLKANSESMK